MKLCTECYSSDFRLSRLRSGDFNRILTLRWPMRCRYCGHRTYGSIFRAAYLKMRSQHPHSEPSARKA
jgi:hypothetical protein